MINDSRNFSQAGFLIETAAEKLSLAGIALAVLEARLLLGHVGGVTKEHLFAWPETEFSTEQIEMFESLVLRRCRREPISHLQGIREFWSYSFHVDRNVLDPRPDSETIVTAALEYFPARDFSASILDIGVGSGCLLLSVLQELPKSMGLGLDVSCKALEVAQLNAKNLDLEDRVKFRKSDWLTGVSGEFDLVLCNPPYIPTGQIEYLEPEVREFEPRMALDGGPDGLSCYRKILPSVSDILGPEGVAIFEVGAGQKEDVRRIAELSGLQIIDEFKDLSGHTRCLILEPTNF